VELENGFKVRSFSLCKVLSSSRIRDFQKTVIFFLYNVASECSSKQIFGNSFIVDVFYTTATLVTLITPILR